MVDAINLVRVTTSWYWQNISKSMFLLKDALADNESGKTHKIPDCHPTFPPKSLPLKTGEAHHGKTYRCKKCRRIVALLENLVDHIQGEGESSLSWHKRKGGNPVQKQDEECSSIFIEPLQWMTAVEEGALEGKLSCIHCYFNWSGIQCSCGSWTTPAFQLHQGQVDISTI